jgi:hypothetical protein
MSSHTASLLICVEQDPLPPLTGGRNTHSASDLRVQDAGMLSIRREILGGLQTLARKGKACRRWRTV